MEQEVGKSRLSRIVSLKNMVVIFLVIYLAVFTIYPIGKAIVGSFYNWNPIRHLFTFTGLDNYKDVLWDSLFWSSMKNTFLFTAIVTLARVGIGMLLALALFSKLGRFKTMFRTILYMPTLTPLVAVAFVWVWLYNPQFGLINDIFGLDINWLKDKGTALWAVMIMTMWKDFGYAAVIYLGGLMGLPNDCFEAADIDGANGWQKFRHIMWPLLKPTTLLIGITSIITYLQSYIQILVMTGGGPGTSTYTISYLIYEEAFVDYRFGSASAMAVVLFLIISIVTYVIFKLQNANSSQ
jgi:multiple sugar transport system permease protein